MPIDKRQREARGKSEKFIVRATGELSSAIIEMDKGSDAILELDAKDV